jgi:hypothetical protein
MRIPLVLLLGTLVLSGCKRETQETVAQAKGAAADAERAARDAADQARIAANQAAASARSAADQARAAADDAAASARHAADDAASKARGAADAVGDSARRGLDNASKTVHELGAGDQFQGVIVSAGATKLEVRPADGAVRTLSTDTQTRWIAHGTAAGHDGFPIGSTVRVTYIVKQGEQLATQVEAVGR